MEALRILYGTSFDKESSSGIQMYENASKAFSMMLSQKGYYVEKFDFAFSKVKMMDYMEKGEYNVIISDGTISSVSENGELIRDGIGFSTIKGWLSEKPDAKIVIIEEQAGKGKAKVGRLFKELNFYNIVFRPEPFTWKALLTELTDVLVNGRTGSQALSEYGIADYSDVKEYIKENPWVLVGDGKPVVESVVTAGVAPGSEAVSSYNVETDKSGENKETVAVEDVKVENEVADKEVNKPISVEEEGEGAASEMSMDEIEAMFAESSSRFIDFQDAEEAAEAVVLEEAESMETVTNGTEEAVEAVDNSFSFGDFTFGGGQQDTGDEVKNQSENVFTARSEETVVVEETTEKGNTQEQGDFATSFGFDFSTEIAASVSTEPEEVSYREVNVMRDVAVLNRPNTDKGVVSARGFIRSVVDYDTILVEIGGVLDGIDDIEEWKCIIKVRSGRKGAVINGRYKSANISFDAYLETALSGGTAMMEVPEFDCEEKREFLEGKECNLIFVKM